MRVSEIEPRGWFDALTARHFRYCHAAPIPRRGPGLPEAPSPISQAVVAGTHCYVNGQLAVDETGTFRPGTAREEAALAFENVFGALAAAGFGRHEIVFVDVAFIDLGDVPR